MNPGDDDISGLRLSCRRRVSQCPSNNFILGCYKTQRHAATFLLVILGTSETFYLGTLYSMLQIFCARGFFHGFHSLSLLQLTLPGWGSCADLVKNRGVLCSWCDLSKNDVRSNIKKNLLPSYPKNLQQRASTVLAGGGKEPGNGENGQKIFTGGEDRQRRPRSDRARETRGKAIVSGRVSERATLARSLARTVSHLHFSCHDRLRYDRLRDHS